MNYVEILLSCAICENNRSYARPSNLRKHYNDHHGITILNVMYESGLQRRLPNGTVEINAESMEKEEYETKFGCPGCYNVFNDLPSLSSHISNTHSLAPEDETTSEKHLSIAKVNLNYLWQLNQRQ